MNRRVTRVVGVIGVLGLILYGCAVYTHTGRVWSLYAFAAPRAPLGVKYTCIQSTNQRVHDKFLQPLNFTHDAKNALKEFWYFSYYRACLFTAGYDFIGAPIRPSTLTATADASGMRYTNYVAQVSCTVPTGTTMTFDNTINPDLNDYIIASLLHIGTDDVTITMDRSYTLVDEAELRTKFAGFDTQQGFPSPTLHPEESMVPHALAFSDGAFYGYVVLIPNHHIVTIYGNRAAQPTIDTLVQSLTILH